MPKLILVDAHGYLHRAYHALPPLTTSKGEPVNAIYGFARMLFRLLREMEPDHIGICFDAPGPTFREKIDPQYKATRKETDENLKSQFPLSRELVESIGFAQFELAGYEADDVMAALARKAEKDGYEVIIVSADKDMLQLVSDRIKVYNEPKQTLFNTEKVTALWGVKPEELVEVFSLMGDSSDNVRGVPGIGEKTAVRLVKEHGSVEKLLQSPDADAKIKDKIREHIETVARAKKLVLLDDKAPVKVDWEELRLKTLNKNRLVPFLKRLEFHNMVTELFTKGILATSKEEAEKFSENYVTVLDKEKLSGIVNDLKSVERLAIDTETTGLNIQKSRLVGISLSWKKEHAAYIPVGHGYLGAPVQISREEAIEILRPILENERIKKIGQNIKFDYSILAQAGVRMKNIYFDTMIASYCLDPSKSSHRLKDLVPEYLGRIMVRIEELVVPKSRKSASRDMAMDQVEIEKVAPYACSDADCTLQLSDKLAPLLKDKKSEELFYEIEMPLVEILAEMEMEGIRVDLPYLTGLKESFQKEIHAIEQESYRLAGHEFNLNSSRQVASILFEKLGLPSARKTKTGFSTDEEVLKRLEPAHPLPGLLLKHRELFKLNSTYIEGLIEQVDRKDSRVHTSFNQAVTATGRLSSSEPNLQNIPIRTEHGRMIRRAFVPEKGNLFLSADYSQIDLRVLAHLSGDPELVKAFKQGEDIHRFTASQVFHVSPSEVTDDQRKGAKAINFGIVYGQQAFGLSQTLGISMSEAQSMIENYFKRYSGVKKWIEQTIQEAKQKGHVKTLSGRIRYLPEINSKNGAMRAFAERTAINTPVQGTSADIIKIAMIKIKKSLFSARGPLKSRMLLQVHDDLLLEAPESETEFLYKTVRENMESALKLSVPVLADVKTGVNWADMKPYYPAK